jgi:hypothetical protein
MTWPTGTGTYTLSVCEPLAMIGGKPEKVTVAPPTLRTMLPNDDSLLFGVRTNCQYAPPSGHLSAAPAVALWSGRLLTGDVASAEADRACVAAIHATVEPPNTRPNPTRLSAARARRCHAGRA